MKPKGRRSTLEETWLDYAISRVVTSTKLLLRCVNLKKKIKKNNKKEKCGYLKTIVI